MSNRRIKALPALAPLQDLSVNPGTSYKSKNVSMLTRILSGEKRDVITNQLNVFGIPDVVSLSNFSDSSINGEYHYLGNRLKINEEKVYFKLSDNSRAILFNSNRWRIVSNYINTTTFDIVLSSSDLISNNWLNNSNTQMIGISVFGRDYSSNVVINENFSSGLSPIWNSNPKWDVESSYIQALKTTAVSQGGLFSLTTANKLSQSYKWYRISVTIENIRDGQTNIGTPSELRFMFGNSSKVFHNPINGIYSWFMQAEIESQFRFEVALDTTSQYCPDSVRVHSITIEEISKNGIRILPHIDPDIDRFYLQKLELIPHTSLEVTAGVAILDDVMINIKSEKSDSGAITLEYGNIDSWIHRLPFTNTDFIDPVKVYIIDDSDSLYFHSYQDNVINQYKDLQHGGDFKYAYLVLYYSNFDNDIPNKAFIGIIKENELYHPVYGEDYTVLAVLRFITPSIVDAIFYYPERPDLLWDSSQITYKNLSNLVHWQKHPINVSIALDMLAKRDVEQGHNFIFQNYLELCEWYHSNSSYAWNGKLKPSRNPYTDYESLIYIEEDNSFWRTPFRPIDTQLGTGWGNGSWTGVCDDIHYNISQTNSGLVKLCDNSFQVNWNNINSGNWPTNRPTNWYLVSGNSGNCCFNDDFSGASDTTWLTLNQTKSLWPTSFYVSKVTGAGNATIVNPFNPYGCGNVPGPTNTEIIQRRFLRADGTWQPTSSAFRYYLSGWPQTNLWVGKIVSDSDFTFTKVSYTVRNAPSGNSLTFGVFKNGTQIGDAIVVLTSVSVNTTITTTLSVAVTATNGDIIGIRILQTGTPPNEGGNDMAITLKQD